MKLQAVLYRRFILTMLRLDSKLFSKTILSTDKHLWGTLYSIWCSSSVSVRTSIVVETLGNELNRRIHTYCRLHDLFWECKISPEPTFFRVYGCANIAIMLVLVKSWSPSTESKGSIRNLEKGGMLAGFKHRHGKSGPESFEHVVYGSSVLYVWMSSAKFQ